MSKAMIYHNCECLKCGVIHKEMIRVGALVFCNGCYPIIFKTENPAVKEREIYLKWLDKHKKEVYDSI